MRLSGSVPAPVSMISSGPMHIRVPVRAGPSSIWTTTRSRLVTGQQPLDPTMVDGGVCWANEVPAAASSSTIGMRVRMITLLPPAAEGASREHAHAHPALRRHHGERERDVQLSGSKRHAAGYRERDTNRRNVRTHTELDPVRRTKPHHPGHAGKGDTLL